MKGCGNMDETRQEEIANQRFALIAPIVKLSRESMGSGERYAILRKIAAGKYPGLELPKSKVGLRTLERYLEHYERGGIEALKPKLRHRSTLIPKEYLDAACQLKRENPSRSITLIITMLEQSGRAPNGLLKPSTVYDYFTKQKLTRPQTGSKTGRYTPRRQKGGERSVARSVAE
jgi:hypothetical protein